MSPEKDIYYRTLTEQERVEAGYFEDGIPDNFDVKQMLGPSITPFLNLKMMAEGERKIAVLVLTGAFAPIHKGHIQALVAARHRLLKEYSEVFAYIVPDHDEYVTKYKGHKRYNIDLRIHEIRKAISDFGEDWIFVSPWAGLILDQACNFTTVVEYIRLSLKKHLGFEIPVFYVAGGDNARFALAFKHLGNCVIVGRPGYEKDFQKYKYLVDEQRIFFAESEVNLSSTEQRAFFRSDFENPVHLVLRVDEQDFRERLVAETLKYHYNSMEVVLVSDQKRAYLDFYRKNNLKSISLDPLIPGDYNLEISRSFDYGGMDFISFVRRVNSPDLASQLFKIPKDGQYFLMDDDICSGATMNFAKYLLLGREIKKEYAFIQGADSVEILDARDFLLKEGGGLTIGRQRVPYILPYVVPSVRASVKNSKQFSLEIFKLNKSLDLV